MSRRNLEDMGESFKRSRMELQPNVLRFSFMKSCQHMAAVSIVVTMWGRSEIKELLKTINWRNTAFFDGRVYAKIQEAVKIVEDDVSKLKLPVTLKRLILSMVKPIGNEIFNWISSDCDYLLGEFLDCLVWTSRGRTDGQQTAKKMLRMENNKLTEHKRFSLACNYCLEDEIKEIGTKMLEKKLHLVQLDGIFDKYPMEHYWSNKLFGFSCASDPFNILIAVLSMDSKNPVSIKYLWNELCEGEKGIVACETVQNFCTADIYCFILSQLDEKQQRAYFEMERDYINDYIDDYNPDCCSSGLLSSILWDWLWCEHFVPTLNHSWDDITKDEFQFWIMEIARKIKYNDQYIPILQNLWELLSVHYTNEFFSSDIESFARDFLFKLCLSENSDFMKFVLADFTKEQKKKILELDATVKQCKKWVDYRYWKVLGVFINAMCEMEND